MVGISIARSTRSGTLVGPGICRKCLPVCTVMSVLPGLVLASLGFASRSNTTIRRPCPPPGGGCQCLRSRASPWEAPLTRSSPGPCIVDESPFYPTVLNRRRELCLRRPHELSGAADHLVDDRPEQQYDRKRGDRADQSVRPEHL